MKAPTEKQVRTWTPDERARVRARASLMTSEEAKATVKLIDSLHLPLSSGGMSADHPIYIEMMEVAWSADGKKAALDAVERGLPAMAGVDPLLQKAMGSRYTTDQQGTQNAGFIVAEVMRHLGYEKAREAPLPANCLAKTAVTWKLRRHLK